jgi:oxalate decarboxylase/phosphoglucose isomerase-like protein (cupin superfamily)
MSSIQILSLPQNFRFEPRGWTFNPFADQDMTGPIEIDWKTFHTVSMEPGTVRGNHVHPQVTEWLLFCGGPKLVSWQDSDSEKMNTIRITNNMTLLIIPPGVKHAVKNVSDQPLYLVTFRSPAPPSSQGAEVLPAPLIE